APVSNGAYLEFMAAGAYERPELWSPEGRRWLEATRARAPMYWTHTDGTWLVRTMDELAAVDPARPVCHVSWFEADAFARFSGKRLPTETGWEAAASWDPTARRKRRYPWGDEPPSPCHANLDQLAFGTARVGAYPRNVSAIGCQGML